VRPGRERPEACRNRAEPGAIALRCPEEATEASDMNAAMGPGGGSVVPARALEFMDLGDTPSPWEVDASMGESQRLREIEFELALTSQLEVAYGLRVRSDADLLDRRRAGYTTLSFGYQYPRGARRRTRVNVGIEGRRRPTYRFELDLADAEQVENVASDCEGLALAIQEHLQKRAVEPMPGTGPRRREED